MLSGDDAMTSRTLAFELEAQFREQGGWCSLLSTARDSLG